MLMECIFRTELTTFPTISGSRKFLYHNLLLIKISWHSTIITVILLMIGYSWGRKVLVPIQIIIPVVMVMWCGNKSITSFHLIGLQAIVWVSNKLGSRNNVLTQPAVVFCTQIFLKQEWCIRKKSNLGNTCLIISTSYI